MRRFLLLAGLSLLFAGANASTLHLLNGNRVSAQVEKLQGTNLLATPAWGGPAFLVPAGYLSSVDFPRVDVDSSFQPNAILHFVNRDRVEAEILLFDGTDWTLRTAWAPSIVARGDMVSRVEFTGGANATFLGGTGDSRDWTFPALRTVNALTPEFWNGSIYLRGRSVVARPLPRLPDAFSLEMDFAVPSRSYSFSLELFGDEMDGGSRPRLFFSFTPGVIHYREMQPGGGMMNFWRVDLSRAPADLETQRIRLLVDTKANRFHLYLNDELVRDWEGDVFPKQDGRDALWFKLTLQHANPGEGLLLRDLILREWNGRFLPEDGQVDPESPNDQLLLANGDVLRGKILRVDPGALHVLPEGLNQEVALAHQAIHSIVLPAHTRHLPRARARDVRASLRQGADLLTLALQVLDGEQLLGTSDIWAPPVVLPRNLLDRVNFNIHMRARPEPWHRASEPWLLPLTP